ncbi:MAG TPA: hypothetical protein VJW55_14800 [Candidatus Angelobacter sp.]|nr:hypothetical protein [Candidatus Angelobacter sp.]
MVRENKFRLGVLLAGIVFFIWVNASAQQLQKRPQRPAGNPEGSLAVTATVVSSTGWVIGPDGQQHLIVANAPAGSGDKGSGSHLQTAKAGQRALVTDVKSVYEPPKKLPEMPKVPKIAGSDRPNPR